MCAGNMKEWTMQLNDIIEIGIIQAENDGMDKDEIIEYVAKANNVGSDVVASIYYNLIDLQNKISDKLGIVV